MFSVVQFCEEVFATGDRCSRRMRNRPNRMSVLKKFALLIGFACCVSRPGACGGLWTGEMLLVCSTYVSVMCMYCVLFDLRRKLKVTKSSEVKAPKRENVIHSSNSCYYGRIKYGMMKYTNNKTPTNITMTTNTTMLRSIK